MKKSLLAVLATATFSAPLMLAAQQPAAPPAAADGPSFEVASIKRNTSGDAGMRMGGPPGRFVASNIAVRNLIVQAYQLQPTQLIGGPEWLTTERFDINATTGTAPLPGAGIGPFAGGRGNPIAPMLRNLLADRFKLKVHSEQREMQVFALVTRQEGTPGRSLTPTKADCAALMARGRGDGPPPPPAPGQRPPCSFMMGPGSLAASSVPMTELARSLSQRLGRIVIDRTGLTGLYDFEVTFAPDSAGGFGGPGGGPGGPGGGGAVVLGGGGAPPPGAPPVPPVDPNAPSLFTALQEQLGLRLDSVRAPVDVIVIDSVERPTED
jgi:bla regulator protein blaR1